MLRKTLGSATLVWTAAFLTLGPAHSHADDWPEWRGKGRLGVWNETGILDRFPDDGLEIRWRTPIKEGFSGPAVAGGRVFVTDYWRVQGQQVIERALSLDEETGRVLWTREWEADYSYVPAVWPGPRVTPTVDGDRVYVLGAAGMLYCLDVRTGDVIWHTDFVKDYGARVPGWGFTSPPLVDGDRLICLVGGEQNAKVVALDKLTGEEVWRALPTDSDIGVGTPVIISAGGTRQLIIWLPEALTSLDPATGKVYWEEPFEIGYVMTISVPVVNGSQLLVSSFYNGSMMMRLNQDRPTATMVWKGSSNSELVTDGLHTVFNTPVIYGDHIYGIGSYGQFRCLDARSGDRIWETQELMQERARWASGFIVQNGNRFFINTDRGDLVIAELSPEGYREISRTPFITPTSRSGNRRELGVVNWIHPAYANKHVYTRNDEELISASLAADDAP